MIHCQNSDSRPLGTESRSLESSVDFERAGLQYVMSEQASVAGVMETAGAGTRVGAREGLSEDAADADVEFDGEIRVYAEEDTNEAEDARDAGPCSLSRATTKVGRGSDSSR